MYYRRKIVAVLFSVVAAFASNGQSANTQLSLISAKINKALNYKVNVTIKVDLPHLTMPQVNAIVYFKQKDKFKVESKSIAVIPKQGFVQLSNLIGDTTSYTAIYQGNDIIAGNKVRTISVIPMSDTGDVILGKLWVDETRHLIMKSQITTKQNGTVITTYEYKSQMQYGLPDVMTFEVDIKKFKIPKALAADINTSNSSADSKVSKKGVIVITLTNYLVNKGIDDAVFKK